MTEKNDAGQSVSDNPEGSVTNATQPPSVATIPPAQTSDSAPSQTPVAAAPPPGVGSVGTTTPPPPPQGTTPSPGTPPPPSSHHYYGSFNYQSDSYQPMQGRWAGIGSLQKDKWVAVVLAFTLGMFGIHKFYLGYKNEGIAMLLIATIGGLCLGLGTFVMWIFALIEAVRYVILTQADFERIYVIGYKGWF
ncbi:MAG: TM2 domain-containing protein [Coriobacteriales bacterium]|jgi:TM2 domain-containing membrane protein YozV|nr:TM2 domain-containing protein [Coriobacteriales bacterium]